MRRDCLATDWADERFAKPLHWRTLSNRADNGGGEEDGDEWRSPDEWDSPEVEEDPFDPEPTDEDIWDDVPGDEDSDDDLPPPDVLWNDADWE